MYNGYQNPKPPSGIPLNDHMKNLSVSSQPMPVTSGLNDYEVAETSTPSFKKPTTQIASFPPRQTVPSFTNETSINGCYSSSSILNDSHKKDYRGLPSKMNGNGQNGIGHQQQRDTPISTFSNDGSIRFANTSGARTKSATSSM